MKNLEESRSSFAENQLKKYGWKEGDGLGKTNKGIAAPVKASLKFNNTGVGFNMADQFTVHWWENLYDTTSSKIKPRKNDVAVSPKLEKKEANVEEKPQSTSILNRKDYFYSRFQKGSTLVDGRNLAEQAESSEKQTKNKGESSEASQKLLKKVVSDDDLLRLCEGRTAHKGARHGIKMNGKLNRVEEQERILLEQMQHKLVEMTKRKEEANAKLAAEHTTSTEHSKKRSMKQADEPYTLNIETVAEKSENPEDSIVKKKKKKSKKSIHDFE